MQTEPARIIRRQIWADPTNTRSALPHSCTPFRLLSGGEINIGGGTIVTLTQDAAYQPTCSGTPVPQPIDPLQPGVDLSVLDAKDPFYSSTSPQLYAISAVTIVSYMLLVILFITPRTYFVGGAGGGGGFLGQRSVVSGAYGSNSVIGVGSRPWLQKLAALTVALSMTIVTADTFKWAHRQYDAGYEDANELTVMVINSLEVRVVRTISETFLWLAQAQTLIRLFPRHKEKLTIKWIAFSLILLELVFSSLNHFAIEGSTGRPKKFVEAVPAMNYLFALTLNLCYGGFIVVYALQKRRFSFYHPHMQNMPLVALLSLTAVLIPIIFFVLDLSKPNVSGWGNYVRWVGAAAASVVVWEWVERIEALEREEKRGGILGREIFDGDEMLDVTPSTNSSWPTANRKAGRATRGHTFRGATSTSWSRLAFQSKRLGRRRQLQFDTVENNPSLREGHRATVTDDHDRFDAGWPYQSTPPPPAASSVHREDTITGVGTFSRDRHQSASEPTPSILEENESSPDMHNYEHMPTRSGQACHESQNTRNTQMSRILLKGLQKFPNPFGRQRTTPPPEVARALAGHGPGSTSAPGHTSRPGFFERFQFRKPPTSAEQPTSVIVVPAPPPRRYSSDEYSVNGTENQDRPEPIGRDHQSLSVDRDDDYRRDRVPNVVNTSHTTSPSISQDDVDSNQHRSHHRPDAVVQGNPAMTEPSYPDHYFQSRTDHDR